MPFAVLAVALLILSGLSGPIDTAAAGDPARPVLAHPAPTLLLAFDDDVFGDRDDDDEERADPRDHDNRYDDDANDDDDDSARGPDDDDDWDVDQYPRGERA
jgi:hypothetical protein